MIGYYSGGYVAGRMSRFSGSQPGPRRLDHRAGRDDRDDRARRDLRPAVRHPQPGEPAAPPGHGRRADHRRRGRRDRRARRHPGRRAGRRRRSARTTTAAWTGSGATLQLSAAARARTPSGGSASRSCVCTMRSSRSPAAAVASTDREHRRGGAGQRLRRAAARRAGWPGTPRRSGRPPPLGLDREPRRAGAPGARVATPRPGRGRPSGVSSRIALVTSTTDGPADRSRSTASSSSGRGRRAWSPARKSSSKWFGVTTSAAGTTRSRISSGIPGRTNIPRPTSPITGSQQ